MSAMNTIAIGGNAIEQVDRRHGDPWRIQPPHLSNKECDERQNSTDKRDHSASASQYGEGLKHKPECVTHTYSKWIPAKGVQTSPR